MLLAIFIFMAAIFYGALGIALLIWWYRWDIECWYRKTFNKPKPEVKEPPKPGTSLNLPMYPPSRWVVEAKESLKPKILTDYERGEGMFKVMNELEKRSENEQ